MSDGAEPENAELGPGHPLDELAVVVVVAIPAAEPEE